MKPFGYILAFLCFFTSCQNIEVLNPPENLIPREKMQAIIKEIALVNAARGFSVQKLKRNKVSPDVYIYEKYGIDSIQYAESTVYYAANSEDYKKFYEGARKSIDSLHKVLDIEEKAYQRRKDSIRTAEVLAKRKKDSIRRAKGDTLKTPKILKSMRPDFTKPQI